MPVASFLPNISKFFQELRVFTFLWFVVCCGYTNNRCFTVNGFLHAHTSASQHTELIQHISDEGLSSVATNTSTQRCLKSSRSSTVSTADIIWLRLSLWKNIFLTIPLKSIFEYLQMLDQYARLERGALLVHALLLSRDVCMCLLGLDYHKQVVSLSTGSSLIMTFQGSLISFLPIFSKTSSNYPKLGKQVRRRHLISNYYTYYSSIWLMPSLLKLIATQTHNN